MYVIICYDNGKFSSCYVAKAGNKSSYTSILQNARIYASRELALKDCCGNEHPVSISDIMK